jgi:tetratricopeptide (TPR) repeat protein
LSLLADAKGTLSDREDLEPLSLCLVSKMNENEEVSQAKEADQPVENGEASSPSQNPTFSGKSNDTTLKGSSNRWSREAYEKDRLNSGKTPGNGSPLLTDEQPVQSLGEQPQVAKSDLSGIDLPAGKALPPDPGAQRRQGVSPKALSFAVVLVFCTLMVGIKVGPLLGGTPTSQMNARPDDKNLAQLNQAIERNRNDAKLYEQRAGIYFFDRDEAHNAKIDLDRAIELDPKSLNAYSLRVGVTCYLHLYEQARSDAAKLLALAPNDTNTYATLAGLENSLDEYDKALTDSEKALKLDPTNYSAVGQLADAYLGLERFDEAEKTFTRQIAMQQPHPHPLVYLSRGVARFDQFDFTGAIEDIDTALRLNPHLGTAMIIRSYAEVGQGKFAQAEADVHRGVAEESSPRRAHGLAGDFYRYVGNYDRAIEEYGLSVALCPSSAGGHFHRGISYLHIGQLQNALEDLQQAAKLKPTSSVLCYLALIEEELGQKQQADADIKRAFKSSVPTTLAYNNRASIMLKRGNAARAIADAKKALAMNRYDAEAYQLLGEISLRNGDVEASKPYLAEAKKYGYPNTVPRIGW